MNKKTSWLLFLAVILVGSVISISCKKTIENLTDSLDATNATSAKTQSSDVSLVNSETDQTDNDVNSITSASAKMSGAGNTTSSGVGDVTIDSSSSFKTLRVTFNGTQNGCKKRTGTITIDLISGNRWVDVGAVLQYTFTNFKVFNVCTNKSITINGVRKMTNISGGNIFKLTTGSIAKLTHQIRAEYKVNFTDSLGNSDSALWHVARKTDIVYGLNVYGFTFSGDTTLNSISNVESWGTTRKGASYVTAFPTPVVSNTSCGLWKPTAGVVTHTVGIFPFTVQYGVDAAGNQVSPPNCAGYYKVTWINVAGNTVSAIISY